MPKLTRARRHHIAPLRASLGGQSFLESRAVSEATTRDYKRGVIHLWGWLGSASLAARPDVEFDGAILDYLNMIYAEGASSSGATKLVAAIMHFLPRFDKYGLAGLLCTSRALKGFAKLAPPRSGAPLLWAALTGAMCPRRRFEKAI